MGTQLSEQLLRLYGLATQNALPHFEQVALRQLGQIVGFNGAVWGQGMANKSDGLVHIEQASLIDRGPQLVADYAHLPIPDPVTQTFIHRPEQAQVVEVDRIYKNQRLSCIRDYLRAYDIGHLLLQGCMDTATGKLSWLTVYRSADERPFSLEDSLRLATLLPHWIQARNICMLAHGSDQPNASPAPCPATELKWIKRPEVLTDRQREVLLFLALGLTYKQIANHLGLSEQTVKEHASNIYAKLGVQNRAEAVYEGRLLGVIE
jgi:DNA-binding CsgD family transcriptional regulator